MAKDYEEVIEDLISEPRTVSSPSGSVSNISVSDAIAADKHVASKSQSVNPFAAIKRCIARGPVHYGN